MVVFLPHCSNESGWHHFATIDKSLAHETGQSDAGAKSCVVVIGVVRGLVSSQTNQGPKQKAHTQGWYTTCK